MARIPPPKPTFTFSTGITVTLERVGPLIGVPIAKANPPPQPPTQRMETAPGVFADVENPHHPAYKEALRLHDERVQSLITRSMLDAGISDDLELPLEEIARFRRVMRRQGVEIPADEDDRTVYILYMLVGNETDIPRFVTALQHYGNTQEAVRAAKATFQSDVQGPASDGAAITEDRSLILHSA
jgi:hypothetical protein